MECAEDFVDEGVMVCPVCGNDGFDHPFAEGHVITEAEYATVVTCQKCRKRTRFYELVKKPMAREVEGWSMSDAANVPPTAPKPS